MLNTKSIMRDRPRTWTFAAITAVFVAVPALTLACGSVFNWHIQQPVYWQSSVELLAVLTAVYIAASRLGRRTRLYGILAVTWLYGRHQGFDLSLAVVFIYLQGISSLGHIFCGRLGLGFTRRSERFFGSLLMGFALWVASIYISSALGLGSSTEIRWLAVLLLGGSVIFDRDRIFLSAVAHEIQNSRRHAAFYAVIITMILAAFAKTTVASDYDSLWYGMNGEQVLTAAGSMFTSEGLVAPVHYYPKAYEALLIPLSGLQSISLLSGFSSSILAVTAVGIILVGRQSRLQRSLPLALAAILVTTPAVANIAASTKGDIFALWLFVCGCFFAIRFRETGRVTNFALAMATALFAILIRVTEIPYAVMFALILIALLFPRWRSVRDISTPDVVKSAVILSAAVTVVVLVVARTWTLTGVPLIAPDGAVTLAERMGFSLKFPVGRLDVPGTARLPFWQTVWAYLFSPERYTFSLIGWTGNAWVLPFVAAFLFRGRPNGTGKLILPLVIVGLMFPLLLLGYHWRPRSGADGNYFIVPIFSLALAGTIAASRASAKASRCAAGALWAGSVIGMFTCVLTGSWTGGIREIDMNFGRSSFDLAERRASALRASDLTNEGKFFANLAAGTRVIGEPDGWWLPVRYEPFSVLRWANPTVSSSLSNFREFLARGGIQYIIASRTSSQEGHNLQDWLADLESRGEIEQALVSEKFVTWRITTPPIAVDNSSAGGMWVTLPQPADCSAVGLIGKVAVHWKFWGASSGSRPGSVAIFVKSADATEDKPWTGGPATGSEETGAWVSPGMQFIAKEQPAGRTIASVTVPSDACKQ